MSRTDSAALGLGVDIVEIARVKHIRYLRRFAEYFLTADELVLFERDADPIRFVASRFAAKEAVIKACPEFLRPHDFQIMKNDKKPVIEFFSAELAQRYRALLSISHSTEYAVGYATIFKQEQKQSL